MKTDFAQRSVIVEEEEAPNEDVSIESYINTNKDIIKVEDVSATLVEDSKRHLVQDNDFNLKIDY